MEMWDWTTGNWTGITDSEQRAKDHCEEHLQPGMTARVAKVASRLGASTPLGSGWTAVRDAGTVTWTFAWWVHAA
jgi:hypothetical protein